MFVILILALLGTVLASLLLVSYFNKNAKQKGKILPPGPYRFPLVGNLVQLFMINPNEHYLAFSKLAETYGDIMSIQLGSVYAVVLNSPAVIQEYLTKPEFSDRYINDYVLERSLHKQLGVIFSKYPEPWHALRRFSLRTLREYGFGKRNIMLSTIQSELTDIVYDLKKSAKENNGVHTFDGYFSISFLNILWSVLAGTRYEHSDQKLQGLIKSIRDMMSSGNVSNIVMAYPQFKDWFPNWTGLSTQRKGAWEINAFSQEFIDERRKLGTYKTNPENMIDEFLREIDAHKGKADNEYTDEQLVILMHDFFLGGSDTTTNTLEYCILYLILNPHVQKRLQLEIELIVPARTFPTLEHESELHYVRATLAEAHRMTCVFPLMVPRATVTDTHCGEYFVPKGTFIMANIHGVHFDKGHWKDPEAFRPERFLDEDGKFKNDDWLMPFGFGKRICPGQGLASMNLIHYLTILMQNFTFHPVPNERLPSVTPLVGFTNGPQPFRTLIEVRS